MALNRQRAFRKKIYNGTVSPWTQTWLSSFGHSRMVIKPYQNHEGNWGNCVWRHATYRWNDSRETGTKNIPYLIWNHMWESPAKSDSTRTSFHLSSTSLTTIRIWFVSYSGIMVISRHHRNLEKTIKGSPSIWDEPNRFGSKSTKPKSGITVTKKKFNLGLGGVIEAQI